ncbi:hypothetical protein ACROYT_G019679 [Oculina patagonica]
MNFRICILSLLVTLICASGLEDQYRRLPNAIAVVGRSFEYFLPPKDGSKQQYKVFEQGKTALPKWLSFDAGKNQLHGLPLWRDKGKVDIEVHLKDSQLDKAVFSIDVQDLHTMLENKSMISNETKVPPFTEPQCSQGMHVAVATIQFDLHMGKLCGRERMNLMRKLSNFADVNMEELHMSVGKGHGTAFGFKDVMMVTAGPGNVADPKEPGIVISWKIGCGMDVAGMQVASLLKSSSEQGTFKQALEAPVSGWHIATGHPKTHQKRVRRQASNLFPTPVPTQPLASSMRQVRQTATPSFTVAPPTSITATSTKVTPTVTITHNTEPSILSPLSQMTIYMGRAVRYQIPADTFFDKQDGFTRNLRLEMRTGSSGQLSSSSWILFDSQKQEIYGLPFGNDKIGLHQFVLTATDTGGKSVSDSFTVQVSNSRTPFNQVFTICLNYDYKTFMNNVAIRLQLMRKIAHYYGWDLSKLQVASYYYKHGAIFFAFQFELSNEDCNSASLKNLIDGFGSNNRQLNPNFKKSLLPEFDVMYGFHEGIGPCAPVPSTNTAPEIKNAIGRLIVFLGQGMRFTIPWDTFYDRQDHYTRNLKLEMRTNNGKALPATSWILFDSSRQEIFGQPNDQNLVGQHVFRIVAIDKGGLETFTNVKVVVVDDTNSYNHMFGIRLRGYSYEDIAGNAENRVFLLKSIAKYYHLNLTNVRIAKYAQGVSVSFRFDSIPYNDCDSPLLKRIIDGFWVHGDKNEVNQSFVAALKEDNITVVTGHYIASGPCEHLTSEINSAPYESERIDRKFVYQGQALSFHIPYDTFYDEQEFFTPNLRLSIRTMQNEDLPQSSWLSLDSAKQDIYGLPLDISTVGSHRFRLVARDRKNEEGDTTLRVNVLEDKAAYNHKFTIRIDNYNALKNDVAMRVKLLAKIASYYGLDLKNVRVLREEPADTFTYRFDTVPADQCNNTNLTKLINGFWSGKNMNPKFVEALSPDFVVISGGYQRLEPCKGENTPPRLINPIKRQTVFEGQAMKYAIPPETFYDKEDGYTTNLRLVMTTAKGENLLPTSWILLFDSPKQEIKSLPIDSNKIGVHKFYLTAMDKKGFMDSDEIEVEVLEDTNIYNHRFTIVIGDSTVPDNANSRVTFVEKLAAYFGVDFHDVRVRSYGPDVPTTFQFAIPNLECDDLRLLKWKSSFIINKKLNENFINALSPEFQVTSGSYEGLDICKTPEPIANTPPQLYNHIDRLNVFQGQGLRFLIPNDTFYDKEDLYTPNLKLEMKTIDGDKLLRTSWILLNSSRQEIYGLPTDIKRIGLHEFLMVAADKEGSKAYDAFEVSVLEDNIPYNHKFNILIDYDNVTFMDNVGVRVFLLDKIASYFGVNFTSVRVLSYTPGVLFTFYFDFLPYEECSHPFLTKLIELFWFGEDLNPQFVAALGPDFRVISGSYEMLTPCKVVGPDTDALVGDRPGGIWWTYAIIPAIVLAIVLLLIGCCVLILMGCCRKQKMTGAEKTTFIYKRKPVVLQEEYEIKELLLKQPIVLPNEKPPVPPVYPRSPVLGGDKTPLLVEETKSVPYQAPTFVSSRQMAGGGGGGSSNAAFANGNGGGAGGGAGGGGGGGGGGAIAGFGGSGGGGVGAAGGAGGGGAGAGGGGSAAGGAFGGAAGSGGAGGGGAGGGAGGGGAGAGGAGGGGAGGGGAGGGAGGSGFAGGGSVGFSMASGGGGFKQTSYSYSYSSSGGSVSGSSRKAAYSGYRLPPAYVPP